MKNWEDSAAQAMIMAAMRIAGAAQRMVCGLALSMEGSATKRKIAASAKAFGMQEIQRRQQRALTNHMVQRLYAVVSRGDAAALLSDLSGARRSGEGAGVRPAAGGEGVRGDDGGRVAVAQGGVVRGRGRARGVVLSRGRSAEAAGGSGSAGGADGGEGRRSREHCGGVRRRSADGCRG